MSLTASFKTQLQQHSGFVPPWSRIKLISSYLPTISFLYWAPHQEVRWAKRSPWTVLLTHYIGFHFVVALFMPPVSCTLCQAVENVCHSKHWVMFQGKSCKHGFKWISYLALIYISLLGIKEKPCVLAYVCRQKAPQIEHLNCLTCSRKALQ